MADFFDDHETMDAEKREAALMALLPRVVGYARDVAPGWAEQLKTVDPAAIASRAALATLPVLRKGVLKELQAARPPFGGFASTEPDAVARIFASPGPIYEPEGGSANWWRAARALHAAGFRRGDVVLNTFAYHLTPGGWIMDSGLRALGCHVIPSGPGNAEQQLDAIQHLKPVGYVGVPDFLKILLDKGVEIGRDTSSIKRALVSGGALFPSLRQEYAKRGITVRQAYATADVGVIAYESPAEQGLIVDEGVILEIVRPGTGDPVPAGEVGEVVVTTFNPDYPMIRLATGDLSAIVPSPSPCGRTNTRIKGWLGRADQTTKIKGMFVHPEQVAAVARRHPELGRLRLIVGRAGELDSMTLKAEAASRDDGLQARVAETVHAVMKLKGSVELVAPDSLPNDGKVIADERTYG